MKWVLHLTYAFHCILALYPGPLPWPLDQLKSALLQMLSAVACVLFCSTVASARNSINGDAAANLLPALLGGSEADFLKLLDEAATIDDVFAGRVSGTAALLDFRTSFAARLHSRHPRALEVLRVTADAGAQRVAVEQVLPLDAGSAWDVCTSTGRANSSTEVLFTTVAELSPTGTLAAVRLYYPSYPITGQGIMRRPILAHNANATTSGEVAKYQEALGAGDADGVAAAFERDGYFREPSGEYHSGATAGVLANFRSFFSLGHGGGIKLEHCRVTTDGVAFVLEYNCVGWGGVTLKPTAGVATYELGRTGRIMGGRVNDNVQPPS